MQNRQHVYVRGRPIPHRVACRDWVCGECESRLVTKPIDGILLTVCARDSNHSPDGFIHYMTLARKVQNERLMAAELHQLERRGHMGLDDRDDAPGQPKRLRLGRLGKVRQGLMAQSQQGKAYPKAVDYFILDPDTKNETERNDILTKARAAIDQYAPGQDLDKPTVLPIVFLASSEEIVSPESYKLRRGKQGMVWCAGNGTTISWKLDDSFHVEVSGGYRVDNGTTMPCPGGRKEGRHPWCEECVPELELNFAIRGYHRTGTWLLRTKSMTFRDQLRTLLGLVETMANAGLVRGVAGVPFLLRRRKEKVVAPTGEQEALTVVEQPITSIEIDPEWFETMMKQGVRLAMPTTEPLLLDSHAGFIGEADVVIDGPIGVTIEGEWEEEVFEAGEAKPAPAPSPASPSPKKASTKKVPQSVPQEQASSELKDPKSLYDAVNATVTYYHSIPHMLNTIRKVRGDENYNWPVHKAEYDQVFAELVDHAKAQLAQKAAEVAQDSLPL